MALLGRKYKNEEKEYRRRSKPEDEILLPITKETLWGRNSNSRSSGSSDNQQQSEYNSNQPLNSWSLKIPTNYAMENIYDSNINNNNNDNNGYLIQDDDDGRLLGLVNDDNNDDNNNDNKPDIYILNAPLPAILRPSIRVIRDVSKQKKKRDNFYEDIFNRIKNDDIDDNDGEQQEPTIVLEPLDISSSSPLDSDVIMVNVINNNDDGDNVKNEDNINNDNNTNNQQTKRDDECMY